MGMTSRKLNPGPEWFQKKFKKIAHEDDWGVNAVYDYAAWELVKVAIQRERRRVREKAKRSM